MRLSLEMTFIQDRCFHVSPITAHHLVRLTTCEILGSRSEVVFRDEVQYTFPSFEFNLITERPFGRCLYPPIKPIRDLPPLFEVIGDALGLVLGSS